MTNPYIFIYIYIYNIQICSVFHFFPVDLLGSRHRAPCPAPVSPVKTCDVAPSDFEARQTNSALRCCCRSSRSWPFETWGRSTHGSLNVPIEHHSTIRYMVFFMATIFGDVQYTQNGTVTNPCNQPEISWA